MPLEVIAERAKKYQPKPKIIYKMIQEYVERKYGFKVDTAYVAEVKQPRKHPPKEEMEAIKDVLEYFEVI